MKELDLAKSKEAKDLHLPLQSINETKLKQLEARLIGPNSEGTLPVIINRINDSDLEEIKISKTILISRNKQK
jgi:hypothetical protein